MDEEVERRKELEDGEVLSSEHGMDTALMNSLQLWLPTHDQPTFQRAVLTGLNGLRGRI